MKVTNNSYNANALDNSTALETPKMEQTTEERVGLITNENVAKLGQIVAARALKTAYQKSGMQYIWKLYAGLIGDVRQRQYTLEPFSDGMDVAQEAALYFSNHIGQTIDEPVNDGKKDKNGKPIDLWRGAFRVCHALIRGAKKRVSNEISLDDLDENGKPVYYEIPYEWDIDRAADLKRLFSLIDALQLTERQAQVLRYRMRGIPIDEKKESEHGKKCTSVRTIAKAMGVTPRAVQKHIESIRQKTIEVAKKDNALAATIRIVLKSGKEKHKEIAATIRPYLK